MNQVTFIKRVGNVTINFPTTVDKITELMEKGLVERTFWINASDLGVELDKQLAIIIFKKGIKIIE